MVGHATVCSASASSGWPAGATAPTGSVSFTEASGVIRFSPFPGRERSNVLETAWNDTVARVRAAHAASLLQPAPRRFVFARAQASATTARTIAMRVTPNARAVDLVCHHRYRVTLRLW